ncbi:TIGR02757 family protein [Emticicia sp. 21SJ11W-3]|uniref:TIGR02757 family protein n=1 Tax=Emticicia sp. 21SJ11W-3 TaxID=2916755 RepID=UPI00209E0273|nr:TIGR02757 family protein [Emticicia sp. 21SJ11W-3]UTA69507.1 TIGR02757 family protein [Emticicia sp. 21SJ11W-3]
MTGYIIDLLNEKYEQFNAPGFIPNDPISIPHRFTVKQDIEIMGFLAATLAWGQRITIINKCNELIDLMDGAPYDFIRNHQDTDLKRFLSFKHRTFNTTDTLYFIEFFKDFYKKHTSLEDAFTGGITPLSVDTKAALENFRKLFFSLEDYPARTRKHIATPAKNSSCKRINMFLRWMVRKDNKGVDFGIWNKISPAQLVCPCDVHVERVARKLGLISRPKADWQTAIELTGNLKLIDPNDPVKYDFALFGLGVEGYM